MGINWRQHFGGRFINADSLGADGDIWTVHDVQIEDIKDPDGKDSRRKLVVYFTEHGKGWVPAKVSAACLGAMFGDDTEDWLGKRVHLYKDPRVKVGGRTVGGVRVKGSPDIAQTMRIKVQVTARRRAEEITLDRTPEPCALRTALTGAGLSVDDFDRWAVNAGRPVVAAMDSEARGRAAQWVAGAGADVVRAAGGEG